MAAPVRRASFDALGESSQPWTAQLALDLLPDNNGPRIEVVQGSVVVAPHAGYDHQSIETELCYRVKRAARLAGLWAYAEVNVVSGDDLFVPDLAVLRSSGRGRKSMPISAAVLLGEIVSTGSRRKDLIDRPREYAGAGVPYFLRVDARNRIPSLVLHELTDAGYRPVVAAAAGSSFAMTAPFEFAVDPGDLLDPEG